MCLKQNEGAIVMAWYHSNGIIFVLTFDVYIVGDYLHDVFQIYDNFIAFVICCDFGVTYSIRSGIRGIGDDNIAGYAMKRIMQNTCIFW
jgi:hypothetical protein